MLLHPRSACTVCACIRLDVVREDWDFGNIGEAAFLNLAVWQSKCSLIGGLAFSCFLRIVRAKYHTDAVVRGHSGDLGSL